MFEFCFDPREAPPSYLIPQVLLGKLAADNSAYIFNGSINLLLIPFIVTSILFESALKLECLHTVVNEVNLLEKTKRYGLGLLTHQEKSLSQGSAAGAGDDGMLLSQ